MSRMLCASILLVGLSTWPAGSQNLRGAPTQGSEDPRPSAAEKEPWQWTVEDRLAARFDPQSIAREQARENARAAPGSGFVSTNCTVDGKRHPELLLASELFKYLLERGFDRVARRQDSYREEILARSQPLGIGPELWPKLEELAKNLLASQTTQQELLIGAAHRTATTTDSRRAVSQVAVLEEADCRNRPLVLEAARSAFGAELFDRFLYQAVAPSLTLVTSCGSDMVDRLRATEEGCR